MDYRWLFLDLETTGLDYQTEQIIEVATLTVQDQGQREIWETLINPARAIPPSIAFLTGIDTALLQKAPSLSEVVPLLRKVLQDKLIVAHHAQFDLGFLEAALGVLPNLWLDTIQLTKILFPNLPSYSLRYLIKRFSLTAAPAHRALADTLAVEALFYYLREKASQLSVGQLQNIYTCLAEERQGLTLFFKEILRKKIKNYDFKEPWPDSRGEKNRAEARQSLAWEPQALFEMFAPQGCIARGFSVYEAREAQTEMLEAVATAFSEKRFLVVEAGTGVGKSLAYLVPALAWAVSQEEKVVVATHTIALQEQLWRSDIHFLKENLPFQFQAALFKGRNNYFCWREWSVWQEQAASLTWPEKVFRARVTHWLSQEKTGDRDTITLRGSEEELFSQLAATKENCQGHQCAFFRECFYQKARHRAQQADLIIVNHSLLLSDAKIGEALLPEYHYLIIDEAHHLEDEGAQQFTETFSLSFLQKRIQNLSKKKYLYLPPHVFTEMQDLWSALQESGQTLTAKSEFLWSSISTLPRTIIRIKEEVYEEEWWLKLKELFTDYLSSLADFSTLLTQFYHQIEGHWLEEVGERFLQKLQLNLAEIKKALHLGERFFEAIETDSVFWLETRKWPRDFLLQITPLHLAELFQKFLFTKLKTVILTSATLSVAGKFQFLINRLGLAEELVDTLQIPSPFAYETQSLLLIDQSLPDPARSSPREHDLALKKALEVTLEAAGGRTLVLFTSHRQLQEMYYALKEPLRQKNLELYADRLDGRRHVLLAELKNNAQAIVFGANTFWEGIDLPGNLLTAVFMVRLPFWPPQHPLVEARVEALEQKGQNGFLHYSLPQAVLRFRQGYGRLIRTSTDWGTVVIFDQRLVKKRYGRVFLNSLPQQNYFVGSTVQIEGKIKEWFKDQEAGD